MGDQDLIKVAKEAVEAFNKEDWDRYMAVLGGSLYNEVGTGRQLRGEARILPRAQGLEKGDARRYRHGYQCLRKRQQGRP